MQRQRPPHQRRLQRIRLHAASAHAASPPPPRCGAAYFNLCAAHSKGGHLAGMTREKCANVPRHTLNGVMDEMRSAKYCRKPKKQEGWEVRNISGKDVWCLYDIEGVELAADVEVNGLVELRAGKNAVISVQSGVVLDDHCIIQYYPCHHGRARSYIAQAGKSVEIGVGTKIGRGCLIMDRNHHGLGLDTTEIITPVVIGAGVTIGEFSIVLPGSVLPDNAVVPSFSVVTGKKVVRTKNASRLIPAELEHFIRESCCYNRPLAIEGCRIDDLFGIHLSGAASKVTLAEDEEFTFYRKPWGPPHFAVPRTGPCTINVGTNTFIHHSTQLIATKGSISIGSLCKSSWRSAFLTDCDGMEGDIVVEDQVWIGAMVIVLPNTRIGRGCMVAAGAVVQGVFPPFSIVAGNPAKARKQLDAFKGGHGDGY